MIALAVVAVLAAVLAMLLGGGGSDTTIINISQTPLPTQSPGPISDATPTAVPASTPEPLTEHIYENAEVRDVFNAARTEKKGEYSIVRVASSEVTMKVLADWYDNYVAQNSFKWCVILYTDRDDPFGVYASSYIEKDVAFDLDEYGDYALSYSSNGVMYIPTEEGVLEELTPQEEELM